MTATSKARILVVDDDPSLLRVVSMRLDKEGYQVFTAESAQKALAQLDASGAQLVLTDLKMAGMDGLALFEAVARRYPGLPVVILTAHADEGVEREALEAGASGFLAKGIGLADLVIVLHEATEHAVA
jgi:two-component system response regulator GlrR